MKFALIGATGHVGRQVLREALHRNHIVTAIARNTQTLIPWEHLNIVSLDIHNSNKLVQVLAGHDAIISTFRPSFDNIQQYEQFLNGAIMILQAVKQANVKRFIFVGGSGSLYLDGKQLIDNPNFPIEWRPGAEATRDYLNLLNQEKELDWTFLSPPLTLHFDGMRKGKYRTGTDSPVFDDAGKSQISTGDLAVAIIDELENNKFIRQRFTAAY